jgi:putative hydrolase of HD superfamily
VSEPAAVVDAQLEAYFARDLDRYVACFAPGAVITNAAGEVMASGHDGIREMYGPLFQNSPDLSGRIVNRLAVGRFVADHEAIDGFILHDSPSSIQAIAVYEVADGKISRVALYF